jgi:hypothetical protein
MVIMKSDKQLTFSKLIAIIFIILIICSLVVIGFMFRYRDYGCPPMYSVEMGPLQGYLSLQDSKLDNDSMKNLTTTKFSFSISVLNENLSGEYNLSLMGMQLITQSVGGIGFGPEKNHSYELEFQLHIKSSDPDISSMTLFGDHNYVNGSISFFGNQATKFIPAKSFQNYSSYGDRYEDTLVFAENLQYRIRLLVAVC